MEKLEQIITTYQQIIQKTELELQNARKRIYYISLLRLILFVGAVANAIIFWSDGWLCLSAFAVLPFILFIWLVKRHNFWFYRKDFLKKRFFVKFGGNLFFISMVFLFFFLNPIKSCRYVCFLVTLKTPHH